MNPYSLHALPFSPHYLRNLVILVRESRAWDIFLEKREWKGKERRKFHSFLAFYFHACTTFSIQCYIGRKLRMRVYDSFNLWLLNCWLKK